MSHIQTCTTRELPFPPADVWRVIADLGGYPGWWPPSTQVKVRHATASLIGSRLEIRPYGGQAFTCEVTGLTPEREMRMAYTGIYTGTGAWTLEPTGSGHTRIGYRIDLHIQSAFIRFLARFLPVTAMHNKLTEQILDRLAQRLGTSKPQ